MGIFNKIRGGAGQSGYPPKKKQFTQPGQPYNPDAVNVFSSDGYKPSRGIMHDKPKAPENRTYEKGEFGEPKKDVWGNPIPYKAQPQSTFQENDDWLQGYK